ncbi:MAG: hypothetical protein IKC37_01120, partial [Clostridia bacterium]|nr:hypothetical protein [Clostridia bacterium]
IMFVSSGGVQAFLQEGDDEACDVLVACMQEGRISYQKELQGATRLFEDVALLSRRVDGLVVCGVETDCCGLIRDSAVVAEKGKILGVADMRHSIEGDKSPGAEYRLFDTAVGKVGVLVSDDLYFLSAAESLTDCGAETLVCVFRDCGERERVLARATAFFCGVSVLLCGRGVSMVANYQAKETFFSPNSPVCALFEPKRQYHLVQTRKRLFYPEKA